HAGQRFFGHDREFAVGGRGCRAVFAFAAGQGIAGINKIFELVPIGLTEWILAIIITILFIVIMDTLKITNNKYKILEGIFSKLN
ncbi:MAG: hypothetical protein ACP5N1_02585, partial [Candidatus Woesearchaeota archaeon]